MATQPASFTWTASGSGTINGSGLFTASSTGGPFVVTATSNGFSNTANITVTPAPASIVLNGLNQVYDGSARVVTATTTPSNLTVALTYNGTQLGPWSPATLEVIAQTETMETVRARAALPSSTSRFMRLRFEH